MLPKEIIISDDNEIGYTNVLAYTELPYAVPESQVRLYHYENGKKVEVAFEGFAFENVSVGDTLKGTSAVESIIENMSYEKSKEGSNGMEPNRLSPNDYCNDSEYLNVSINSNYSHAGMAEWSTQSVVTRCPSGYVGSIPTPGVANLLSDPVGNESINPNSSIIIDGEGESNIINPENPAGNSINSSAQAEGNSSSNESNITSGINNSNNSSASIKSDRLINYITWVVPHLSNQTYELIIEISKAEHLDENRTFIEDIYDYVKAQDEIWSPIINNGEYVRVTFEKNLTSNNDITIYARQTNKSVIIDGKEVSYDVYLKKKRIDEIRREMGE